MKEMNNHIINTLHKRLNNFSIDCYNDSTFNWSKGYQKALMDIIDFIKISEIQK